MNREDTPEEQGGRTEAADTVTAEANKTEKALRLRSFYAFFLPLIFMTEMMMISHSIIHATLARMPDPKQVLAAYNVAFSFHSVAGAPVWAAVLTSLSFITGRRSVWALTAFYLKVSVVIFAVGYLTGLSPLGDLIFGTWMGASAPVVAEAKAALLIFMLIPPITIARSLCYAILMQNRVTLLITLGTFIRVLALGGFLVILPWYFDGASVGAAALFLCILVETVLAVLVTRPFFRAMPADGGERPSQREIWRFSWPLMLVQGSENGVAISINFFLGQLLRPDLALAAFGVMDGLHKLLMSPLRNLAQTAQTLVRGAGERALMRRFTAQVLVFYALVMCVFFAPPVRDWVLYDVMGLTAEIGAAIAPALQLFWLLSIVIGVSATFRGLLLGIRRTGRIAISGGGRLAVVVLIGSIALFDASFNGAMLGVIALIGAFAAEAVILGHDAVAHYRRERQASQPA